MKRLSLTTFAACLTLSLSLTPGWATSKSQKVTATGEGSGGSTSTQEQVKQIALADAKRMALEQVGTQVISETEVSNFELIRDNIKAFAQGWVKVLKITDQKCAYEDKVKAMHCQLTIEAEVQADEVEQAIKQMDQQGPAYISAFANSIFQEQTSKNQAELSFSFNILPFRPAPVGSRGVKIKPDSPQEYNQQELKENGVLKSRDEFQLRFTPSQDAYVYVISVDSHNQVYPMLPNPEGMSDNHLKAGHAYTLPADGKYYQLDDQPGQETLYLLAARQPMADVGYIIEKAQAAINNGTSTTGLAGLLQTSTVKTRSISGITTGKATNYQLTTGVQVQEVEEVIKGSGAVIRRFEFKHE